MALSARGYKNLTAKREPSLLHSLCLFLIVYSPFPSRLCCSFSRLRRPNFVLGLVSRVLRLFGQRVARRQERLWRIIKKLYLFDWLLCFSSVTASIVLPQKSCGNNMPVPQSLSWRPAARQRAWGISSGYEIANNPPTTHAKFH